MGRTIDPSRRCLPVAEWPPSDQVLWNEAIRPRELEDETSSPAALWKPTSLQTNREGYGRWINFLARSGFDLDPTPHERVTAERVRLYLAELSTQDIGIRTRCNRVSQLLNVMLAIAPEHNWSWLRRRFNRLASHAREAHEHSPPKLLAGDILDHAFKALGALENQQQELRFSEAILYRDWLMLATMTLAPLRRKNFASLSLDQFRQSGPEWLVEVSYHDAKGSKKITMPLPKSLHRHLRYYIGVIRPKLLKDAKTDRLWISNRHTALASHSVYVSMTAFTTKVFGTKLEPHSFRRTGATSMLIANPGNLEAARAFLGHADSATTREHYITARSVAASRERAKLVEKLRRTLV